MCTPYAPRSSTARSVREYPSTYRRPPSVTYSPLSDPHLKQYFRQKLSAERSVTVASTKVRKNTSPGKTGRTRPPSTNYKADLTTYKVSAKAGTSDNSEPQVPAEGEVVSGDVEGEGAINGTSSQEVEPYENQPSNNESYIVSFRTSDFRDAGTNAQIYMTLNGQEGTSEKILLPNDIELYERGMTDEFKFVLPDLGEIEKVIIGHDGTGEYPNWHLAEVTVTRCTSGQKWVFPCERWITTQEETSLYCSNAKHSPPTVTLCNSPVQTTGEQDSLKKDLEKEHIPKDTGSRSYNDYFVDLSSEESKEEDQYGDDSSFCSSSEHEENPEIDDEDIPINSISHSNSSIAQAENSLQGYEIKVVTSDKKDAGTCNDIKIQLRGSKASSRVFTIHNKPQNRLFQRNQVDTSQVAALCLGTIKSIRICHIQSQRNKGGALPSTNCHWHLFQITVRDLVTKTRYFFSCKKWLNAGIFEEFQLSKRDCLI